MKYLIIILLFFTYASSAQVRKPVCTEGRLRGFHEMLVSQKENIEQPTEDEEEWYSFPWHVSSLLEDPQFLMLFNNPNSFYSCYEQIINQKNLSHRSKYFAILSMGKLSLTKYILIVRQTYRAYLDGLVNEYVLEESFQQSFLEGSIFTKNKNNSKVLQLLEEVSNDPKIPLPLKKTVHNIIK